MNAVHRSFQRARDAAERDPALFITLADEAQECSRADADGPLGGLTFAVKDNIDVAGLATTAGCPSAATTPSRSAPVVDRLRAAGATLVGKTNLDQFATGLVGTRSPLGTPRNPVDGDLVPGGSSSGSATAVALGVVDFALGTDTAGSGRVPAAHQRLVGLKPTRGRVSTSGVLPAVRSLDCVSVFSRDVATAWHVLRHAEGFDPDDPFSRSCEDPPPVPAALRIGIARDVDLDTDEDRAAWHASIGHVAEIARSRADWSEPTEVDIGDLVEVGELLYGGAWLAERTASFGHLLDGDDVDPTVKRIVDRGREFSAVDAHRARYELAARQRMTDGIWDGVDVLVVPTVPGVATLDEVAADPIERNTRLGRYTNWVNLLDQCAIAVPGVDRSDGRPFGISIIGPAWADPTITWVAAALRGEELPEVHEAAMGGSIDVVVVGAHLEGQPLNWQLTSLGGRFVRSTTTSEGYRLYVLDAAGPPKPALVRDPSGDARSIAVEVWRLPIGELGRFLQMVPAPLGLGSVSLADGSTVKGFIAEASATTGAREITGFGSWRAFLADGVPS